MKEACTPTIYGMAAFNLPYHQQLGRPVGYMPYHHLWATLVCWYETMSLVYPFGISTTLSSILFYSKKKKREKIKKGTPQWYVKVGGHPMESVSHGL
jgi:hypothetical protein